MKYMSKMFYGLLATSLFLYANTNEEFIKASNGFFAKGKVFQGESTKLMDNTHTVDKNIHEFAAELQEVHKTTTSLIALNNDIATLKLALIVGEIIPQTKAAATKLMTALKLISTPVSKATNTMKNIDKVVAPVIKAAKTANEVTTKLVTAESIFRQKGISYLNDVETLSKQCQGQAAIDILNASNIAYAKVDTDLKKINTTYSSATKVPAAAISVIMKEIKVIKNIEKPIKDLSKIFNVLLKPLNDIKVILDKKVNLTVPYVCGVKTCQKSTSYPCGTKKCHKKVMGKKIKYACGVKTCQKNISYPCGTKECKVNLSLSVADIIQDVNALENKIEKMISGVAYQALKAAGLGNAIKTLKAEAEKLMASAMKALHLNIKIKLPSLAVGLNLKALNLSKLANELQKIELEMKQLSFPSLKKYTCK